MSRSDILEKSDEVREMLANVRLRPTNLVRTVHTLFRMQFLLLDMIDFLLEETEEEEAKAEEAFLQRSAKAEEEVGEADREQLVLVDSGNRSNGQVYYSS
ncbi:hypothetical protein KFU94_00465 [Chloroflexi bacterium TSY]|nr:hypothetical protein [Chloroflexi bacterium TSY]